MEDHLGSLVARRIDGGEQEEYEGYEQPPQFDRGVEDEVLFHHVERVGGTILNGSTRKKFFFLVVPEEGDLEPPRSGTSSITNESATGKTLEVGELTKVYFKTGEEVMEE
ncbi:hypothetical protein ACLOJK_030132 [Asimina triloba]